MLLQDPVVSWVVSAALAAIFLIGAITKIVDFDRFVGTVQNFGVLPRGAGSVASLVVVALEVGSAAMLLIPQYRIVGGLLGLTLMIVVTGAVLVNLIRGRANIDCGCGGAKGQRLSMGLLYRNTSMMLGLVGVMILNPSVRQLTAEDAIICTAGIVTMCAIYFAANQVLANSARLRSGGAGT